MCIRDRGEEGADIAEHTGVGGRVGARGAANGRLVNADDLIDPCLLYTSSDVVRGVFIYIVSCIFLGTLLIISTIIITAEFKLKQNGCLPPH